MSYLNIYTTRKDLDTGGYDVTGFNKYSTTLQTNNGVLPTTNYYNDNDTKFCNYTSEWDDESRIDECIDCVSNYGFYGDRQFYCDGKCMSKHNVGQVCTDGSLVARNIAQCFNPCYASLPTTLGTQICNTDVDCNINEVCGLDGFCEAHPYITSYKIGNSGYSGYSGYTGYTGYKGFTRNKNHKVVREKFNSLGQEETNVTPIDKKTNNMFIGVL